ncbi:hypothetical protein AC578_2097 [Pseudocercospora eumusae]|uniref:cytidine deaminase n=1 Tax=Pseudocercospora eumusae TaxID=321146 RepID=A0A139HQ78_9PEZI|nr:hypothetical protein AC578_2097 [Pseudocercospora eumusae]
MADSLKSKPGHARHDTALIHGLSQSDVQKLSESCVDAKSKAYCPYSHFRVGCAVLLANGDVVQGANVENAAYPVGTCAERVALGTAVGAKKGDFRALAVSTDISPPASPCGMCRQFIREFCELNTPILMYDKDGKSVVMTLEQLLPMSFGPDKLLPPGQLENGLMQTQTQSSFVTRAFSTTSSRRQDDTPQVPQSHYDFFPQTFPQGPPPKTSFSPDLKQLRKEFLQLQAKAHPDLAPQDQKRRAEALSMRINEAYKTLQSPLRRAQYLLSQQGIDVEDETAKLDDSSLLMEVMEAREAVEEVEDEEQLNEIRAENNGRIEESVRVLEDAFRDNEFEKAAQEAIRLRYWVNIEESIQGWEKGNGGGILHH